MDTANRSKWEQDCLHYHGEVLAGEFCHWCPEWDDLPIDDTCWELHEACSCVSDEEWQEYWARRATEYGWRAGVCDCGLCEGKRQHPAFSRAYQMPLRATTLRLKKLREDLQERDQVAEHLKFHHRSCALRRGGNICTC